MFSKRYILALIGISLLAISTQADDALEKRATWKTPTTEEVKQQIDKWVESKSADEVTKAKIDTLWNVGMTANVQPDVLEQVAEVISLLEPSAKEIVEFAARKEPPLALPDLTVLTDETKQPFVRDNLRLLLGRWLAQHNLYDEALEQIATLEATAVVDPASLLFYQSVCHHRLLQKQQCLPAVAKLLENKGDIPRRYETVAVLMEADLKPLKTDSLDEVARLMDDIERRLGLGRAGKRVRKEEDDVVAKLDKMIDELEKQQQQQQAAAGSAGGAQSSSPMQDSMPGGGSGPGNVDNRDVGSRADWGDLPPKKRQEALQQIAKGLPSHYREVIEEYFRKLARDGN